MVDLSLNINLNCNPSHNQVVDELVKPSLVNHQEKMNMHTASDGMVEELKQMNKENERLAKMLSVVCENYNTLQSHLIHLITLPKDYSFNGGGGGGGTSCSPNSCCKRKSPDNNVDEDDYIRNYNCRLMSTSIPTDVLLNDDSCTKQPFKQVKTSNVSRIFVRTRPSENTLVIKDGYQWRKYGQKVTRDNPSPRAYYKCSFAPNCPVKKKVQRSVEDSNIVVATYEGEHNHHKNPPPTTKALAQVSTSSPLVAISPSADFSSHRTTGTCIIDSVLQVPAPPAEAAAGSSTINVDLPQLNDQDEAPLVRQILVEKMASSLTTNPSFTQALAAAISNKILDYM